MNKLVAITLGGAFCLPQITTLQAAGSVLMGEPIVVSATRSEQSSVSTPASITVINREAIEQSGARHIVEVLQAQGGIQTRDLYGDGSRATISMRGFSANAQSNTLIMVDGRRLNTFDLSSPDLNSIALKDVQQIEIIQGSAGTLFGDQAVGGVINVITRKAAGFSGDITLRTGSYGNQGGVAQLSNRLENGIGFRLSAEYRDSENYREHNRSRYANAFGMVDYEYESGHIFAELQHTDEKLELPGALTMTQMELDRTQVEPGTENDYNLNTATVGRFGISQDLSENWQLEAEISQRNAETEGFLNFGGFGGSFEQVRKHKAFTPRMIGLLSMGDDDAVVTLGLDMNWDDYESSGSIGTNDASQTTEAIYAQGIIPLANGLSATLGGRYAQARTEFTQGGASIPGGTTIDRDVTVYELGLSWALSNQWRLFGRRDGNFRFAKVDEQTYTSPGVTGLDPQTGTSYELGGEWHQNESRFKLVAYRLDLENEIDFDEGAEDPFGSPFFNGANVNLDDTQRTGLILEGGVSPLDDLDLSAQYTYTDPRFSGGSFDGNEIPLVAAHVARLAADYRINTAWALFGELTYTGKRYHGNDYANNFEEMDPVYLVNMNLSYNWEALTLGLRANNLLDEEYSDSSFAFGLVKYYPAPERNFMLTANYSF
ncbi:MAG: TonB-dependent receptor [Gammaproteobacteria bacterium]|nr:TonB-dependent receptor [Gammaproteobacteria bacterium]